MWVEGCFISCFFLVIEILISGKSLLVWISKLNFPKHLLFWIRVFAANGSSSSTWSLLIRWWFSASRIWTWVWLLECNLNTENEGFAPISSTPWRRQDDFVCLKHLNLLSANATKWSNTLKQFVKGLICLKCGAGEH